MTLYRRGADYSIRVDGEELMSSTAHASEEALARIACGRVRERHRPRVLVGGLGMGYTLAAALRHIGERGEVVVAELAPAVVKWNRGPLSRLAGSPLEDPRTRIFEGDVGQLLQAEPGGFDAILLDVDNGPEGFTRRGNDWLYGRAGVAACHEALRPGGVLAVWSATPDRGFAHKLRWAGFGVEDLRVPASPEVTWEHTIWIATRA